MSFQVSASPLEKMILSVIKKMRNHPTGGSNELF
jgi:hypothetical protein